MGYLNIPLANPFKFVPDVVTPGAHFDDSWACKQIKDFEMQGLRYCQKWNLTDSTALQIESSLPPSNLLVYNINAQQVLSIPWVNKFTAVAYSVYELTVTLAALPPGIYFLYIRATFGAEDFKFISEPIHVKASWSNTLFYTYSNSYNNWGVAYSTGVKFGFRCESAIMNMQPERTRSTSISQTRNVQTLSATPYRTFKLFVADARGVFPYIVDILNRIFCHDSVNIEGKLYESEPDSKWEVTRIKGYPLVGAALDITPKVNELGVSLGNVAGLAAGIVTAYNIETDVFGAGATVPITEVIINK